MLTPVYELDGVLAAALSDSANAMLLNAEAQAFLASKLGAGDWTYVSIQQGSQFEIVKVTAASLSEVEIERAVDYTTAQNFLVNAKVRFTLTESAVMDIIEARQLSNITLEGKGIVTVDEIGPGEFSIYAPPIKVYGTGKIVVYGDLYSGFTVSTSAPIGCCEDSEYSGYGGGGGV